METVTGSPLTDAAARLFGTEPREWQVPTALPPDEVLRRVQERAEPHGTGFALLGRHADRDGRTYYTARSVDPIEDIRFRERFTLRPRTGELVVHGRPSPALAVLVTVALVVSVLGALGLVVTAAVGLIAGEDAAAAVIAAAIVAVLVRSGLMYRLRHGDQRRMHRWLESILSGDE